MRISGTLLDRLIIRFLPFAILLGAILYFTMSSSLLDFTKKWTAIVIVLWLFDSILLIIKRIRRLSIVEDRLQVGDDIVNLVDLLSVNKIRDERRGTVIRTIELEYLKNGMLIKKQIITKPTFGDLFGQKTKTIDLLIKKFPELKDRVFGEV